MLKTETSGLARVRGYRVGLPFFHRRRSIGERWYGGALARLDKGHSPRVPSCASMKIYRIPVPIDVVGVLCSRRLHRQTPLGVSFLEIAGSNGIRSCIVVFFI
jgi:hypothetical protein